MIKILMAVNSILESSQAITDVVGESKGNRIFPNVIPDYNGTGDIDYPILVTNRTSLEVEYAKGGCHSDEVGVEITAWGTSYQQTVELIDNVRTALENYKGLVIGIQINDCRISGATEGYSDSAYYQTLTFLIR